MRHGSLFSGYLGLDMAAQAVFGGSLAWVSDIDPGACKILEHRAPGVPNLGDITTIDWAQVEPVDVMDGGFPCQPVSHAGKRLGDQDERWLWDEFARAIGTLRPRYVVLENVRGLLSAGRGRLFGRVLADLAAERYDAQWTLLRAADVGAPHGRARVFILAENTDRATGDQRWLSAPGQEEGGRTRPHTGGRDRALAANSDIAGRQGAEPAPGRDLPARGTAPDAASIGRREGRTEPARLIGGHDVPECGDATADADRDGQQGVGWGDPERREADGCGCADEPRPTGEHAAAADAASGGGSDQQISGHQARQHECAVAWTGSGDRPRLAPARVSELDRTPPVVAWGAYEPAIRRWERVLGRPAPAPTQPGRTGNPQLSPAFVEWLMGLPAGWVTDVPGLTHNQMLKALGNGVVSLQAEAALRSLLAIETAA